MSTYVRVKPFMRYQTGNIVQVFTGHLYALGEMKSQKASKFEILTLASKETVLAYEHEVKPVRLFDFGLRLLGFHEHKNDKYAAQGKYYSNGLIDIIPISRFLEGMYGPSVTDEEYDDPIPEIDEPDPNQLMMENLIIYEPVNQPVKVDFSQYLLYNRLFDHDGNWQKMREEKARQQSAGSESYEDEYVKNHDGYELRWTKAQQTLYDHLVYNHDKNLLEGMLYLHELQNVFDVHFPNEKLRLERFVRIHNVLE